MQILKKHIEGRLVHIHAKLDKLLYGFSTYGLPAFIGLMSFIALLLWDGHYHTGKPETAGFRYIVEKGVSLTPQVAFQVLETTTPVRYFDTNRSEAPFWFSFSIPAHETAGAPVVEFPSRHAVDVKCWDENFHIVGQGSREGTSGEISQLKAGFALTPTGSSASPTTLVCQGHFIGPARFTLLQWDPADLQASSDNFHRKAGLLDGGLLILAVFMLVTALIVRQSRYLLFAAWLLVNLRVGSLSAGWDAQWLGQTVPYELLLRSRLITVAASCVLTITLFSSMFREDLAKVGKTLPLRMLQWTCFPLMLLSVTLSYRTFLPFLWVASSITVIVVVVYLGRILLRARSAVALLYAASLTIMVLSSLTEILSAAFGWRELTGAINSVTAALSSSLLASLALAEQMRQEHQDRLDAQAELAHTYEVNPIGLFTLDMTGRFLSANPALTKLLGGDVLAQGQNQWSQYLNAKHLGQLFEAVHQNTYAEIDVENDDVVPYVDAKRFLVKATLARGKIEASLQDITEKFRAMEELRFLANNDPLTKVYNRRGIEMMMEGAMKGIDFGRPVAIGYLDLDRFKLINSLFGHTAGDEVLRQVCDRIKNMLTGAHQIGRVGGDEFLLVFPDTPIELAAWTARGIVASIGTAPYRVGENAFQVRASIGLIEIGEGMTAKDLIATADRACRAAKGSGKNGLVVYDKSASVFHEHEAEFQIVERLSAETGPRGLFLDMQPIMSLKSPLASLNFEVLLRMRDTDGSVIPAGQILAAAENSGRTSVIDRWVLATTLDWIDMNTPRLRRTEFVCMNLSGASLNDERFVQDAITMLEKSPRAATRLCIEITESVALNDRGNTRRFIDKVRSCGAKIALDDFGAGYTSFAYLKELPADVLKIDGSFIVNMNTNPANVAIVEAIVSLAKSLGMQTIAEWAEDNETVETLAEIGIDYVQGYAIARPQTPERILSAPSAASFIKDEQLAQFVRTLGDAAFSIAQMDLLAISDSKDLH